MKRSRLLNFVSVAISLLAVLLFLGGCGGDDSGANGGADTPKAEVNEDDGGSVDACEIVTQEDATELFGQSATRDESGALVVDPGMLGECLWEYDIETSSSLIQFRIWDGEQYYAPLVDSEPFDVGDKGSISVSEFAGVDIEWVQDGNTITLSYFTTGPDAPEAEAKVEEVKALAREASERL